MEDTRVTFETEKLAKEKGCNLENCTCGGYPDCICSDKRISQSLLAKWLREQHNIDVWVTPYLDDKKKEYNYMIVNRNIDVYDLISGNEYNTYEEAYEIGLQEALKLIK